MGRPRPTTRPRPRPTTARTTPRPLTTRRPRPSAFISSANNVSSSESIFDCSFERFNSKDCKVKFSGKDWVAYNSTKEQFYEIVLGSEERSEIFFPNMVKQHEICYEKQNKKTHMKYVTVKV